MSAPHGTTSQFPNGSPEHRPNWSWLRSASCIAALVCVILVGASCIRSKPLTLGFLGTLSGRFSDLSFSGHNGVMLALEECNRAGGINGQAVALIEEDDCANPTAAVEALHRLIKRGAVAVIGPMISSTAIAVAPVANKEGIVLMSPTVSTNQLTGLDDHFFRVYTPSELTSRQLARQIHKLGARRIVGLYDLTNRAHTEQAYRPFRDEFLKLGGEVLPEITFFANEQPSFSLFARRIVEQKPDAVFLLMGTMDTALFAQCMAKTGSRPLLCCTDWSGTSDLTEFGGRATDGLIFLHSMDKTANHDFRANYLLRFGNEPDFAALRSYEAASILIQSLRLSSDRAHLRDTLLRTSRFKVGDALIELDAFGDVRRPHYAYQLRDGVMKTLPVVP